MNAMRAAAATSLAAAAAMAPTLLRAQSLAARVSAVRDGTVLMSFPARPDVCGDGSGGIWVERDGRWSGADGRWACVHGPVRVVIGRSDNQTVSVRTRVGRRWTGGAPSETDLGDVPAPEAARYLVELARTLGGHNASEALSAAAFADGVDISPELARLVRDTGVPLESRKQALFWLGQGDASTTELVRLYEALSPFELREHYTFVLSQRHDDAAIDKLIDIAGHDADREIRKRAMFWLGQSRDPKAIKFFRDVLKR
jgi:hypothetical protein